MLCAAYLAGFVLATPEGFSIVYANSHVELLSTTEASEILEASLMIKGIPFTHPQVVKLSGRTRCPPPTQFASLTLSDPQKSQQGLQEVRHD